VRKSNKEGTKCLELRAQHFTLVSAFNGKSQWVMKQTLLPEKLGTVSLDHVFLFSPQLLTSAFLGIDILLRTLQL
jgi:hypothetical protein